MALSEEFRKAVDGSSPYIRNDNVIQLSLNNSMTSLYQVFDFVSRTMCVIGGDGRMTTTPFKDLDEDVVQNLHAYMISKQKNPLPLPERKEATGLGFTKDFGGGMK